MTKQDFVIIAAALNKTVRRAREFGNGEGMANEAVADMADALAAANPRFDKGRFIRAALA